MSANSNPPDANQEWADRIIHRVDPAFRHRWEAYDECVRARLEPHHVWLDCGCGDNGMVTEHGGAVGLAVGVDLLEPGSPDGAFVTADIRRLPFASGSFDLVTLRFVVEHFPEVSAYFREIARVVKADGVVIVLTTNTLSPPIFVPRFLLPYRVKQRLLTTLFKVGAGDVFPTYHKLNSPGRFERIEGLRLEHLTLISDLNFTRRWIFWILLGWHLITRPRWLHRFRMNILAVLAKR